MTASRKIAEIEMLRGVAILATLVFHVHNFLLPDRPALLDHVTHNYVDYWWGVDLFFAISGYVIARSLLPAIAASRGTDTFLVTASVFWVRRAWRLIPSAWLWLTISVGLTAVFSRSGFFDTFHVNVLSAVAAMLCVANVRLGAAIQSHTGYGITSAYWSLSLEEQFYLVLPVAALLAGRRIGLLIGSCALVLYFVPNSTTLMVFRIHAALLGVLLAIGEKQAVWRDLAPMGLTGHRFGRALTLGLPILLMAVLAANIKTITPTGVGMIAVLSAILVWLAGYNSGLLMADGPLRRVLCLLGDRSYGLYLVHLPAFALTRALWLRATGVSRGYGLAGDVLVVLSGVLLTAAFSEVNHRIVEVPLRERGKRVAARMQARAAASTSERTHVTPVFRQGER